MRQIKQLENKGKESNTNTKREEAMREREKERMSDVLAIYLKPVLEPTWVLSSIL